MCLWCFICGPVLCKERAVQLQNDHVYFYSIYAFIIETNLIHCAYGFNNHTILKM